MTPRRVLLAIALPLAITAALVQPALPAAAQHPTSAAHRAVPSPVSSPAPPSTNPLAGRHWDVYKGPAELAWAPYAHARGQVRKELAHIALQPKATWFGRFIPNASIGKVMRRYIDRSLRGHARNSLVQMTIFRVDPWEGDACHHLPTAKQRNQYKVWIDRAARQIRSTHVALILQPDGPFALCAPHHSKVYSTLINFAARKFSSLPHTSVYIDAGAADWFRDSAARALKLLLPAGIRYARGFALNSTHYSGTDREVAFGAKVAQALARRGIPDKHFVVDTAQNGQPFAGYTYKGPDFDFARVCRTRTQHRCVTLGIPPTLDVGNPQWGLTKADDARAVRYCDAYLWFGRPWLGRKSLDFDLDRALDVVRTRRYPSLS